MTSTALTLLRRVTRLILTIAIIGVLANDTLRVAPAVMRLSDGLGAATNAALSAAAAGADAQAASGAAAAAAAQHGVALVDYRQDTVDSAGTRHTAVRLAVSTTVTRTAIAAPLLGALTGTPPGEWYGPGGVPLTLRTAKQVDAIGSGAP